MQIYGPYRVSTAQSTTAQSIGSGAPTRQSEPSTSSSKPSGAPTDQLDLSSTKGASSTGEAAAAGNVNRLAATEGTTGGDIRIDRVADMRRQIASGNYETPEKLDAALDRMLDAWG